MVGRVDRRGRAAAGAAALVLVALGPLGGCGGKGAPAAAPPAEVLVAAAETRDVPIPSEWVGTLEGSSNAQIRAQVQGYLEAQRYHEGGFVKMGDPLFEIDARPYEAALALAKAQLAKAQADLGKTDLDVKRLRPLAETKAVSQQDLDNAVQANFAAKAQVAAAEAAIQQAEINLDYTHITAPIDGIAGKAQAQIGDLVGAGVVLTSVSKVDPIRAVFAPSEQQYIARLKTIHELEQLPFEERPLRAELILAGGSVHPYKGRFEFADRHVDPQTGTIKLVDLFPNPGNVLRPGQFIRIRIPIDVRKGAVLVPQRAVAEIQGTYHVDVVRPDDTVEVRPVKTAERVGSLWIIAENLAAGERVIVEGLQKVRPGAKVAPKPFAPAAPEPPPGAAQPETPTAQPETPTARPERG
jgi:membrane fusion protein (multidrug efflux system)